MRQCFSSKVIATLALAALSLPQVIALPSTVLADRDDSHRSRHARSAHPKACEKDYVLPGGRLAPHRGHFSLAIKQRQTTVSEVIVRVSTMDMRPNGYLNEHLVGDFRYKMNQRAKFLRGVNPGDRVIVRIFTTQNQLIGYSAFELLPDNAVVNLVLSDQPVENRTVRTVVGFDVNDDGNIDANRSVYSYFTQVTGTSLQTSQVTFLKQLQTVNASVFQVSGLPDVNAVSSCNCSFSRGNFALLDRTLLVFTSGLAPALVSLPGQTVQIINVTSTTTTFSVYEVSRQVVIYKQVGFTTGTMTEMTGVVSSGTVYKDDDDDDNHGHGRRRRHCNQGIGNGSEGCDPGNSHPHGGSNDEGGRR